MKFKLDENLPTRAAEVLRTAGHDVVHLLDQAAPGTKDADVAQLVRNEGRALITLDLGFADIGTYPPAKGPANNELDNVGWRLEISSRCETIQGWQRAGGYRQRSGIGSEYLER